MQGDAILFKLQKWMDWFLFMAQSLKLPKLFKERIIIKDGCVLILFLSLKIPKLI